MGAYLVNPVCIAYGTRNKSPSMIVDASPAPMLLTVGGPSVPLSVLRPAITLAGNVPVIPVREKRGE